MDLFLWGGGNGLKIRTDVWCEGLEEGLLLEGE